VSNVCATSGDTTQSYEYGSADRLLASGLSYDSFGRITALPGTYAGGSTLSTSYFSNDMVASQSQGGITNTFQLDAALRQRQRLQGGAGLEGTEIFHYAGASDSPAWTQRGATWTRNIAGIGGELAAVQENGGEATLQLTNLHGDVVATAASDSWVNALKKTFNYDEFGNPTSGTAGRYGWLGGKQRRTELPSGVIQMGARSYVPEIGRFISVDPVRGGSANSYDYVNQDPVNGLDLTGERPACTINQPSVRVRKGADDSSHSVKARAWAHCSKAAKHVQVKAIITGGAYYPAPGRGVPIHGQTGPLEVCGNGGVKFACEMTAGTHFEAQPPCGVTWKGYVTAVFFVSWETRSGRRLTGRLEAYETFAITGICA
jgi:RHS repeat-associated protein